MIASLHFVCEFTYSLKEQITLFTVGQFSALSHATSSLSIALPLAGILVKRFLQEERGNTRNLK